VKVGFGRGVTGALDGVLVALGAAGAEVELVPSLPFLTVIKRSPFPPAETSIQASRSHSWARAGCKPIVRQIVANKELRINRINKNYGANLNSVR